MDNKFKKFMQVGLIVDDVDAFVQRYEKDFGVGPWEVIDFNPDTFPSMLVDGKPSTLKLRIAFCRSFEVELELIQPISESIFMDWLRKNGPGIHHVAFAPTEGYDAFMRIYTKNGKRPLIEVSDGNKTRGFAYLDFMKELGFNLEIHRGKPG